MRLAIKFASVILLSLLNTSCSSLQYSSDFWRGMERSIKVLSKDKRLCDYGHPEDQVKCEDRQKEKEKRDGYRS